MRAACFDLLSALLDSWTVWDGVAASLGRADVGRAWRGRYLELTSTVGAYRPYLALVGEAAAAVGLPEEAAARLERAWDGLRPWPDVLPALGSLAVPAAVVTNCSLAMGRRAAACVGAPFEVVVTAEEAGAYKPDPRRTGWPASGSAMRRTRSPSWPARRSTHVARWRLGSR